eukprot:760959-Hanusia_phi.AAC.1
MEEVATTDLRIHEYEFHFLIQPPRGPSSLPPPWQHDHLVLRLLPVAHLHLLCFVPLRPRRPLLLLHLRQLRSRSLAEVLESIPDLPAVPHHRISPLPFPLRAQVGPPRHSLEARPPRAGGKEASGSRALVRGIEGEGDVRDLRADELKEESEGVRE